MDTKLLKDLMTKRAYSVDLAFSDAAVLFEALNAYGENNVKVLATDNTLNEHDRVRLLINIEIAAALYSRLANQFRPIKDEIAQKVGLDLKDPANEEILDQAKTLYEKITGVSVDQTTEIKVAAYNRPSRNSKSDP